MTTYQGDILDASKEQQHLDLEIKDAGLIFSRAWAELEAEYDRAKLSFPREIIWLGGAPGSGKGTNTPYILDARGITAAPVVVSNLLDSPRARQIKDAGGLVGDEEVVSLMLHTLLDAEYEKGAIVDGFPRTKVQAECLKKFYDKMTELHSAFRDTAQADLFRRPLFQIVLLFVDEEESVKRQLKRGRETLESNRRRQDTGIGLSEEVRSTDLVPETARKRYQVFKETTFEALQSLRQFFHFHFINAEAPLNQVQLHIEEEFLYQSSLELEPGTFECIRPIPLASQIVLYARQEMVKRLDGYHQNRPETFAQVAALINSKFIPIVQRYANVGTALINSEDSLFEDPEAIAMLIDIFSERGYQTAVDVHRVEVPDRIDLETYRIISRQKRVYRFQIRFAPSSFRRGDH